MLLRSTPHKLSPFRCCLQKEPTHEHGLPVLNGVNGPHFQSRGGEYIIYGSTDYHVEALDFVYGGGQK